uniref:Uncharacterized protein n=1 Tax=Sciurus vulgaris TaxID=55149 RepID=A0A8D2B5M5_SCIVU
MGQQISDQTQLVINKLPEKVAKHVTLVQESSSLTYEEFLGRVAELNDVTAIFPPSYFCYCDNMSIFKNKLPISFSLPFW